MEAEQSSQQAYTQARSCVGSDAQQQARVEDETACHAAAS